MAEYIGPVQAAVMALVAAIPVAEFGGAAEFVEVGRVRRVSPNFPCCWVEAVVTGFNPEGTMTDQLHELRVIVGVTGSTPDEAAIEALRYVGVVTRALTGADLAAFGEGTRRVFVAEHDYGPLYGDGNGFGMFPAVRLLVETTE